MDRIFYRSVHYDDPSGTPIYIFDTSFLPPPETVDYEVLVPKLMERLPKTPYTLVMFSCGLNRISWLTGVKFIQSFVTATTDGNHQLDLIVRIITVHDSWLVKSITEFWTAYASQKRRTLSSLVSRPQLWLAQKPILHLLCLADLVPILDVSRMKISLNVYRHDIQIDLDHRLRSCYPPLVGEKSIRIDAELNPVLFHHFYLIFTVLDQHGCQVPLLFFKPGNKTNTDIFYDAINRNQVLYINDFDLHCIAAAFKRLVAAMDSPLVNVEMISLPVRDDFEYTAEILMKTIESYSNPEELEILLQILAMCLKLASHQETTSLTSTTLAKSLVHTLSHQVVSSQNKDQVAIATRFLRNLIELWPQLLQLPQVSNAYIPVEEMLSEHHSGRRSKDLPPTPVTADIKDDGEEQDNSYDDYDIDDTEIEAIEFTPLVALDPPPVLEKEPRELPSLPVTSQHEEPDENIENTENTNFIASNEVPTAPPELGASSLTEPSPMSPKVSAAVSPPRTPRTLRLKSTKLRSPEATRSPKSHRIAMQYPPQKYRFEKSHRSSSSVVLITTDLNGGLPARTRKTVIRGRRVGELTKLFEERAQAMEILRDL